MTDAAYVLYRANPAGGVEVVEDLGTADFTAALDRADELDPEHRGVWVATRRALSAAEPPKKTVRKRKASRSR